MEATARELPASKNVHLSAICDRLTSALASLKEATQWIAQAYPTNPGAVAVGSVYYLKLMGITSGGWMMARAAQAAVKSLEAGQGDAAYLRGKLLTARFYADHILPQAMGLSAILMRGADSVLAVEEALL
jgi:acyl-CoA dehydrogenase